MALKKEVKNVVEEKKEIESGTVDSSGNEVKEEPKKTIVIKLLYANILRNEGINC